MAARERLLRAIDRLRRRVREAPPTPLDPSVLRSFGGLHESRAELRTPSSIEELRSLLVHAARDGRRVTLRAGGQSLDGQAIGDDLVISMRRLDWIDIDAGRLEMTVGPGATWGEILRRLPPGLVPHVMVTTSAATAGGTLSADSHSRFSPAYGREAEHVKRLQLLTVDGRLLECTRDNEHAELFSCAIGGMGYLGAVTSITYELLDLRHVISRDPRDLEPLKVETVASKYESYRDLVRALLPAIQAAKLHRHYEAVYAVVLPRGRGILFRSGYIASEPLAPMPNHDLDNPLRSMIEWALRWPTLNELGWRVIYSLYYRDGSRFVDTLYSYTFFMDGTRRAKETAARFGVTLKTIQQTFIVPIDLDDPSSTVVVTARFLEQSMERLLRAGRPPLLCDVLYLPMKEDLYATSSRELSGVAVTFAFSVRDDEAAAGIRRMLEDLSHDVARFGGRVHLVKNVHVRPDDSWTMYGEAIEGFLRVKRRVDPEAVLRNAFLERLIPGTRLA